MEFNIISPTVSLSVSVSSGVNSFSTTNDFFNPEFISSLEKLTIKENLLTNDMKSSINQLNNNTYFDEESQFSDFEDSEDIIGNLYAYESISDFDLLSCPDYCYTSDSLSQESNSSIITEDTEEFTFSNDDNEME
jgi:hypothetical protein